MAYSKKDTEELEAQVARIRARREKAGGTGRERLRQVLNATFMAGAAVGVAVYFAADHVAGLIIVAAAMVVKVAEFVVRLTR